MTSVFLAEGCEVNRKA